MSIDTSGLTKIVFCEEGVAGTTRLRLDHDVVLGIETWNLGQLNELLVIVPEDNQNWSAQQTKLVAEITSISAQNIEQFLKSFATTSPNIRLDQSFGRLAMAENLSVQLSDLYALEALFICEFNPAMRTAIGQTANRGVPIIEDIYFKAESPNFEFSVDLMSEAVLDIFSGNFPNLGFVDNQRTFASSTEESDTPAYPVPNALRRPTVPLNAILIDDFDIDHFFVNRAWYTVSANEKFLEIFALSEFQDMDTFASVIDVTGTHRLQLQPTSETQDDLFLFQALTPWDGDSCRIEIHQSKFGESAPRSNRSEVYAKQLMANVTARLQTVARTGDFAELIQADPTLDIDLDRSRLIFDGIAKRPDLALACEQIRRSFANPHNNESLFSSWERCQTIEIVRKLLSIGIDSDLPEIPELNEQSKWSQLRRSKELVDTLNAQLEWDIRVGESIYRPVDRLKYLRLVDEIDSRTRFAKWSALRVNYSGMDATPASSTSKPFSFDVDTKTTLNQAARQIAQHTLGLQSLALNLFSSVEHVESQSRSVTGMESTQSSRRNSSRNNIDILTNRLRIAQSSV